LRHIVSRAMLVAHALERSLVMTSHRILQLNAVSTAVCALGMLAVRQVLHPLFGLDTPILLDTLAVGLLAYAGLLALAAHRRPVTRQALIAFTVADGAWVVGSAIVLVLFWADLAQSARFLIIAVALVVEVFATLQFIAAGRISAAAPRLA
jgi:hypothetical protein